jgi:ABC-type glycerol-3-phosphate transport system substrate-binding protein
VATALRYLKDLVDTNAMPLAAAHTHTTRNPAIYAGKVGMYFDGPWMIGSMRTAGFFDWDITPVAKGPAHAGTSMMVDSVQMVKTTMYPQQAWEFMKYLATHTDSCKTMINFTGRPPALLRELRTYLDVIVLDGRPVYIDAFVGAMHNSLISPVIPPAINVNDIIRHFRVEVSNYLTGKQSLEATLIRLDDLVNPLLAQ